MGQDAVAEFLERMKDDPSIEKGLVAAQASAIVDYARGLGFDFTVEELAEIAEVLQKLGEGEISDEELEGVAGGSVRVNALRSALGRDFLRSNAAGVVVTIVTFGAGAIGLPYDKRS
jgi:predicted ribosomally synthesized peptide with nif11-like leader